MLLSLVGAGLIATSVIGATRCTRNSTIKRVCKAYFSQCKNEQMKLIQILKTDATTKDAIQMKIQLPLGMEFEKFKEYVAGLELATCSAIKLKHIYGRICSLTFGFAPFYESMLYHDDLETSSLAVPLYTPFGLLEYDFANESNCHLVIGGATRMGKTVLIRLIVSHLMKTTKGRIKILLIDNKVTDVNMFQNIPQIKIAETLEESYMLLEAMLAIVDERKELLKSKKDVVDAKEFRIKYPEESFDPIFIIIDEYGRFSEDKAFQKLVTEFAETSGYLDVHLVIGAQRPDANQVLNARIKANIVSRISFSTANEANSRVSLDLPDAAYLGMIQGRAYLLVSELTKIQVPYISSEKSKQMMLPYYRRSYDDRTRQEDHTVPETVQSIEPDTLGEIDLPGSSPTKRNRKSNSKKTGS